LLEFEIKRNKKRTTNKCGKRKTDKTSENRAKKLNPKVQKVLKREKHKTHVNINDN
jgi:hypothetical protein